MNKLDSICLIFSSCPTINEDQFDFISGQLECDMSNDLSKGTTVLLLSGLTSDDVHVHQSEVRNIGMGSAEENCENWADYSPFTSGATGGLMGDRAVLCGGYNSMQCYEVNKTAMSLVGLKIHK